VVAGMAAHGQRCGCMVRMGGSCAVSAVSGGNLHGLSRWSRCGRRAYRSVGAHARGLGTPHAERTMDAVVPSRRRAGAAPVDAHAVRGDRGDAWRSGAAAPVAHPEPACEGDRVSGRAGRERAVVAVLLCDCLRHAGSVGAVRTAGAELVQLSVRSSGFHICWPSRHSRCGGQGGAGLRDSWCRSCCLSRFRRRRPGRRHRGAPGCAR
jgi:hypothetical protein